MSTHKTFDPAAGTGALLLLPLPALSELTLRMADAAAELGDVAMTDAFWQLGVSLDHKE